MARHSHAQYGHAEGGDVTYETPHGGYVQVPQDFAFADTVVAMEEEIPTAPLSQQQPLSQAPLSQAPLSQPPLSHPEMYETRQQAYPAHYEPGHYSVPPPTSSRPSQQPPGLVTSVRGAVERAKYTIDSSRSEMQQLWSATEDPADPRMSPVEEDPFVRLAGAMRRMRTMWSFFEWDRADVMRAAWIGVAVFVLVATVGAFALQR